MSQVCQNVLDNPNVNTVFMVWNFRAQEEKISEVFQRLCALVGNLNNTAQVRFPNTGAGVVLGVGVEAWDLLGLGETKPKQFRKFQAIEGAKHTAVSTRGDIHLHIRGAEISYCIDTAAVLTDLLLSVADAVEEVHGFRYWDGRSILGFVDGTENPQGDERADFALIGAEDEAFLGSSYLFVQKYLHDMAAWRALPVSEQEKVIGRTKVDDIEMDDDTKPSNSHSALSNVGDDLKVIRDNMPFGQMATGEMGTYFIAYARYFSTIQLMLKRMFIGNPVGNYDRILDFSTAKTGTLFFVPSLALLDEWSGGDE